MVMRVYELKADKGAACDVILRSLPRWFGIESAIVNYVKEIESMLVLVADMAPSNRAGLLSLKIHNDLHAEIHLIGVLPQFHGKGVGTALVSEAESIARLRGIKFMSVKTLSPSRPNKEYDLTRKFYSSVGFVPFEEFKTLWGEVNPCLMMIKAL